MQQQDPNCWKGKSVLSVDQFSKEHLESLFDLTKQIQTNGVSQSIRNKASKCILVNLFYEPSTRTSTSFHAAMLRLGGQAITLPDVKTNTSVAKGETLEDTIRCLENYADLIVLRHSEVGSAQRAASVSAVPIINAGDGIGEHPTQALLDLFTIHSECQSDKLDDGLTITMLGDLKNGRTVHSLSRLLKLFPRVKINFVSPRVLQMPREIVKELEEAGLEIAEWEYIEKVIAQTDVLYVTRVQKERFTEESEYKSVAGSYQVNRKLLDKAKSTLRILHPLPRVDEIVASEVDQDERATYFKQMKNGLWVRMALLALVLGFC